MSKQKNSTENGHKYGHGYEYGQDYGDGGHISSHGHNHGDGNGVHINGHGNGKRKPPLPLYIVTAAASGDTRAMCALLNHYAGYIATLSMRWLTDERGHEYRVVDEDKQQELTVRLITAILNLKAAA